MEATQEQFYIETFNNYIRQGNFEKAFEYRNRCFRGKEENTQEFTREKLIELLDTAKINYQTNAKNETLLKKCIENNLI